MAIKAKLHFFGGSDTVTGANFLLEADGSRILVDCGLFQGFQYATDRNRDSFSYDPASIDYLFITHAHIDHIGRVPQLVRNGFSGKIYSTPETRLIAEPMFQDALSIMQKEDVSRGMTPLYEKEDIEKTLSLWNELDYGQPLTIGNLNISLFSAGHVLGSAMVKIGSEKNILFTGDMGNTNSLLLDEAPTPSDIEYLVMESVYGDRNHEDKDVRKSKLLYAINKVKESGGTLIIPAFSLERTQHILFEINNLVESGEVTPIPVYLDSPLAIKLTEIYKISAHRFKESVQKQIASGDDIFNFPKLNVSFTSRDSVEIWRAPSPKIILAGSGMSMGGRVILHEKNYLADPKNIILFVGYQAAGSLGRRISEGEKKVSVMGEKVNVRAEIMQIGGYSSHRDSDGLVDFVSKVRPGKVFVVLGEPKTSTFLAQRLREELDIKAEVSSRDSDIDI